MTGNAGSSTVRLRYIFITLFGIVAIVPAAAFMIWPHLWVIAGGVLLGAFLAWNISIRVARPLEHIAQAAQHVGAGDLSPTFATPGKLLTPAEISETQVALQNMAVQLRDTANAMKQLAYIDNLTALPNRQRFRSLALAALQEAHKNEQPMTMLFCDLNDFKQINDNYGHRVGDEVLKQFAARLDDCLQRHDPRPFADIADRSFIPGRLGGDEFAVFFKGLEPHDVVPVAQALLSEIRQSPGMHPDISMKVGVSIGLAGTSEQGHSLNHMLRCADVAMYHAKRHLSFKIAIYNEAVMGAAETTRRPVVLTGTSRQITAQAS